MDDNTRVKRRFKRKRQLEKDLEHVTHEMYGRNLELARTNRTLSLLRTIDNLVLGSQESLQTLCQKIGLAIVNNSDYVFVSIFGALPHKQDLEVLAWSTTGTLIVSEENPLKGAFIEIDKKYTKDDKRFLLLDLDDIHSKTIAKHLHSSEEVIDTLRKSVKANSFCLVKLMARQELVGIMAIGFSHKLRSLSHDDEMLLERLSEAVGVALDNRLLYEENKHVLEQLQKTNNKLRALDEAKDEFISMASHQLRTPLTSVKGYVSMVLEGDAGKVGTKQRDLLNQAFTSSQRMVYLIADLLNVSRLRTGKFVIEAKPTNLADVVEGEIAQLVESAKSRTLELTYHKPAHFPDLMLDETKIRQVIMNFVDNAIYYTPAGGHIQANLAESDDAIEFTVVDDGLGVPKAEQHHLFGKFYRAGNAKKARPDGTGLGLFMAKKVIVASGGGIIFKSEEGKGSTFGFSFPKAKLKVTTVHTAPPEPPKVASPVAK